MAARQEICYHGARIFAYFSLRRPNGVLAIVEHAPISGFPEIVGRLVDRRELAPEHVEAVFDALLTDSIDEGQVAAFLVAMRMKGETAGELAAAARQLRKRMVRFETGRDDL